MWKTGGHGRHPGVRPGDLLDPQEVPDDALIVPIAMMGAPTVLIEKGTGGKEYQTLYDTVSQFFESLFTLSCPWKRAE